MKKIILPLAVFWCLVASFGFQQDTLRRQLIGEWRNVYLKIKLNINDKAAQPTVTEADSATWEARLGIKPIRTHFNQDNTYYSEYRNLKDSIVRRASGTWNIVGDSLTMTQTKPDASTLKMHVSIKGDHATFTGIIDFNGDGKKNDDYFGIQKKFSTKP